MKCFQMKCNGMLIKQCFALRSPQLSQWMIFNSSTGTELIHEGAFGTIFAKDGALAVICCLHFNCFDS